MKTKADYDFLAFELSKIEKSMDVYLADENVDRENTETTEADLSFWDDMHRSAAMSAGQRAEDYGLDINELLGRVVY